MRWLLFIFLVNQSLLFAKTESKYYETIYGGIVNIGLVKRIFEADRKGRFEANKKLNSDTVSRLCL